MEVKKMNEKNQAHVILTRVFAKTTDLEERKILDKSIIRAIGYNPNEDGIQIMSIRNPEDLDGLKNQTDMYDIFCMDGREGYYFDDLHEAYEKTINEIKGSNRNVLAMAHPGERSFLSDVKRKFPFLEDDLKSAYSVTGGSGETVADLLEKIIESKDLGTYQNRLQNLSDYISDPKCYCED